MNLGRVLQVVAKRSRVLREIARGRREKGVVGGSDRGNTKRHPGSLFGRRGRSAAGHRSASVRPPVRSKQPQVRRQWEHSLVEDRLAGTCRVERPGRPQCLPSRPLFFGGRQAGLGPDPTPSSPLMQGPARPAPRTGRQTPQDAVGAPWRPRAVFKPLTAEKLGITAQGSWPHATRETRS
jgi:hypothetical protein